ncbi:MAG: tRNA (adenosine(37)-N6)-threonylcarbamoyltransferase complex dimerization subunit type 1 TsaB [Planctomycetota bacterium]|nr:MAG: tRNA (adenosine(37)-N6)-threonylcarbamoyltransferase complex dimerization subunit type 1 TsaB [Planctomycetota bacterium]RLS87227.1 MAG: tRNA (adenosine(37)-N6)-threonylcarbamoyltransferase complex dimerization subunit type 1 TsaB [Planctomycetota bacterium]RLS99582.1 MAG: tRNA (adenosine(37)-N6)-threonylcarbamoyltransferase complex dimerization subunit type 1 TsaB [Planctomycetota bacterium]
MTRTILAIDCSQRISTIVLSRGPIVYERSFEPANQAEREPFWDELRELCAEAFIEPWEFEAVAVVAGPGGFTGLRVSIAFAKAFALAREVPAIALGSAAVFAASDAARSGRGPWLVTLASKSGSAWCARVTRGDDGSFIEEMGEVLDAIGFLPKVSAVAAAGGVVLSDEHLDPAIATVVRQADAHTRAIAVDPCALAALAQLALSRNATTDPFALAPIYPREPEAVTKWRERHPPKP